MTLAMFLATTALSGCMASSVGDSLDQAAFSGTPPMLEESGTGGTAQFAVLSTSGGNSRNSASAAPLPADTVGSETELASAIPVPSPSPRSSARADNVNTSGNMSVALAETAQPVRTGAAAAAEAITDDQANLAADATSEGSGGQALAAASPEDSAGREGAPQSSQIRTASLQPEQAARKPSFFERLAQRRAEAAAASAKPSTGNARPLIDLDQQSGRTVSAGASGSASGRASGAALPGVQSGSELFGIGNGNDDDSLPGEEDVQVASVGPLGRMISNGLILQTESVKVDCFKPELMKILRIVERHYGKRVMVTSGYRSPDRNRRAGGVQNSTHVYCKAADIQVEGVTKWDLAKFLRTVDGRGGVGTYCRTESVHIDVGTQRDWHHPCRRGGSSARKKA